MADQNDLMQAKQVFDTLCQTLDGHDWVYEKDESELTIECGAQGEDLPIQITIRIDPKRHVAHAVCDFRGKETGNGGCDQRSEQPFG